MSVLVIGPIVAAVFVAGMWIGHPLHKRRAQARADAMVNHLLSGLAADPGEIRKHRRPPRGWNDAGRPAQAVAPHPEPRPMKQRAEGPPTAHSGGPRRRPAVREALHVAKHASDDVAGWDTFTYPGRHAYGSVRPIVGIEARAAYDAAVLTVQTIIRSVHSKRELVTS